MPHKKEQAVPNAWSTPLAGLAGLIAIDVLIAYTVPKISTATTLFSSTMPVRFHQALALILVTAVTVIYLAYFRAKFFFSTRWLLAALTYNFLIIFVKFTLSTNELAGKSNESFGTILSTAFFVSLLYIFANTLLYLIFDGKLLNRSLHKALIVSREGKVLLAMGLFVCATVVRILIFRLPGLSGTTTSSYVTDVFRSNSALISALLFVMIIAGVEAYA